MAVLGVGSYFYGSGSHYNPTSSTRPYSKPGTNRLNIGAPITIPAAVLDRWEGPAVIATGTTWPRNALRGMPLHKVDMRVTKTITLVNNVNIELLGEVFNVFNRKNYGAYNTTITSAISASRSRRRVTPMCRARVSSGCG